MASSAPIEGKPHNLLDGVPTGHELQPPDSDYGFAEAHKLVLGDEVLPVKEWPDHSLLVVFLFAYGRCIDSIFWTLGEDSSYQLPANLRSHKNPSIFLDLEGLTKTINDQLTLAQNHISDSEFLPYLRAYNLLVCSIAREIQQRLKYRKLNLKWLKYLQTRFDEDLVRFLDDLTPGNKVAVSKLPKEFSANVKRHIYALPWEDREDEKSKAWIWFMEWINRRVVNRVKIAGEAQRRLEPDFIDALEQNLKYLSTIYWSFAVSTEKVAARLNPDGIARLQIYSRMRDEYRKMYPPLRELSYVDENGKQRYRWAEEVSYDTLTAETTTNPEDDRHDAKFFKARDRINEIGLGMETDPASIAVENSIEGRRNTVIELLKTMLPIKERALLEVLTSQIGAAQGTVMATRKRAINVSAAAKELRVSRQMCHRYLKTIRKIAAKLGSKDLFT